MKRSITEGVSVVLRPVTSNAAALLCVGNNSTTIKPHIVYMLVHVMRSSRLSPRFVQYSVQPSAVLANCVPVQGRASLPQRTHHVA